MSNQDKPQMDRRTVLTGLSLGACSALAGCTTQEESSGDSGERVPTLTFHYWPDSGDYTQFFEDTIPQLERDLDELGIELNLMPKAVGEQLSGAYSDEREAEMFYQAFADSPDRLDPFEFVSSYSLEWAGSNGQPNHTNYATCEYSIPAEKQKTAPTEEERQQYVTEALKAMSEDPASVPVTNRVVFTAVRNESVEPRALGDAGMVQSAYQSYINSQSKKEDNNIMVGTDVRESATFPTTTSAGTIAVWSHLVHSTLTNYDENYELQQLLADSIEISDDGKEATVELIDATFHNGDAVTADDVKFTFEYILDNSDLFPKGTDAPIDSIEIVDEKTTQFNLSDNFPPLETRMFSTWGILSKELWEDGGANETPEDVDWGLIGNGPYEVDSFQGGQLISLTPYDDHPVYSPSSNIILQNYDSTQAAVRALNNEEIDVAQELSSAQASELEESLGDDVTIIPSQGFACYEICFHYPVAPSKHSTFRRAVAMAINREQMNQLALEGEGTPMEWSTPFAPSHPWWPGDEEIPKSTDSPSGNIEMAKEILEDDGWTIENGRLHYPPDIDNDPVWPDGSEPTEHEDEFPCIDEL